MIALLFFLSLATLTIPVQANEQQIMLESPIVKIADASFIDANKIEIMRTFRQKLLTIILGKQLPSGEREGNGAQALAQQEQELIGAPATPHNKKLTEELREKLAKAKAYFLLLSNEFMESGRGSKNILVVLIEEDCQKRNRMDSLLLEWAKTPEGSESAMFEERITSFTDYYHFCTDLANFLLDLIHSCPKAAHMFKERVMKWGAVKKIFPKIIKKAHVKQDSFEEIDFLRYLKDRYLDKIELENITTSTIAPLLAEYVKNKKA